MGHAVVSVVDAFTGAHYTDRKPMKHGPVANELVGTHRCERRYRVHVGSEAGFGDTGRHPDHVLFRRASVEEAVRKCLGERLECGEAKIPREQNDPVVSTSLVDQRLDELTPHWTT